MQPLNKFEITADSMNVWHRKPLNDYVRSVMVMCCQLCGVPESFAHTIGIEWNERFTGCAGKARKNGRTGEKTVLFSVPLFSRATPQENYNTVVHEMCHQIVFEVCKDASSRPHGREWQHMMKCCGVKAERCHHIDRTGLRRKVARITVECGCGERTVTKTLHTKMLKGSRYLCGLCKVEIKINLNINR